MTHGVVREVREQVRGITGALLVLGLTLHYTMETWWLGRTLPLPYLVGYAVVGLVLIVVVTRVIGFHEAGEGEANGWWSVPRSVAEILMQSFVTAYGILLLLGIVDVTSSPATIARLGLIEAVPLGFGAAMANRLFGATDDRSQPSEGVFPQNLAIFAVGALFLAGTIAPTQEMELIAVHMDWVRYPVLVAVSLLLVYLVLYELEFKGQRSRLDQSLGVQVGTVFLAYAVALTVSFLLLLGFGHFVDASVALAYQETVVLAFPASLGAAGAEVLV